MPNHTPSPSDPLLGALTLEQGAAIATLPEPARTTILACLQVRASDDDSGMFDEGTFGEDRAAELYLAARAAIDGVDALAVLKTDPFEPANMATYSTQFDRLICAHHYEAFRAEHPADQPLEPGDPHPFVGLMRGGPGTSSWHAPGHTAAEVLALAAEHEDEGLQLVELWDLRTGAPAVSEFVVTLTVRLQARTPEEAYDHVHDLAHDLNDEAMRDAGHVPGVRELHATDPVLASSQQIS